MPVSYEFQFVVLVEEVLSGRQLSSGGVLNRLPCNYIHHCYHRDGTFDKVLLGGLICQLRGLISLRLSLNRPYFRRIPTRV